MRSSRFLLRGLVPCLALIASGCSTVTSTKVETVSQSNASKNARTFEGIAYFLPRRLAQVKATRTNKTLARAIADVARKRTALEAAIVKLQEARDAVQAAVNALDGAKTEAAQEVRLAQIQQARIEVSARELAVATARNALGTSIEAMSTAASGTTDTAKFKVDVSITLLPPTADPGFAFRLDPNHSILRDDEHDIEVGANGLLQSTSIVADDRTDDILVELGTVAGAVSSGAFTPFNRPGGSEAAQTRCPLQLDTFSAVVDISNKTEVDRLNEGLLCIGAMVEVEGLPNGNTNWMNGPNPADFVEASNAIEGIVYRTPVDVSVVIYKSATVSPPKKSAATSSGTTTNDAAQTTNDTAATNNDAASRRAREQQLTQDRNEAREAYNKAIAAYAQDRSDANKRALDAANTRSEKATQALADFLEPPAQTQEGSGEDDTSSSQPQKTEWQAAEVVSLSLPQAGPISIVRQDAGAFTRTEYDLVFQSGTLTQYDSSRPSEALAIASTPLKIVNGFFEGFSQIISLQTGRNRSLAELSASELELLNARAQLERGAISNQRLLSSEQVQLADQLAAADVAALTRQNSLSQAQQSLLTQIIAQEYAVQIATLQQQQNLATANQTLAQTIFQTQNSSITNQTSLLSSQLALLQQQAENNIAQINVPNQILEASVAAQLDRLLQESIRACVERELAAGNTSDLSACAEQ